MNDLLCIQNLSVFRSWKIEHNYNLASSKAEYLIMYGNTSKRREIPIS